MGSHRASDGKLERREGGLELLLFIFHFSFNFWGTCKNQENVCVIVYVCVYMCMILCTFALVLQGQDADMAKHNRTSKAGQTVTFRSLSWHYLLL